MNLRVGLAPDGPSPPLNPMSENNAQAPNRFLLGLCLAALAWTVVVLQAGGFTTSINAGMAFLDWPLSNGSVNPPGWLQELDKFAEHSHRLAATGLGILAIVIAVAHRLLEARRPVRLAAYAILALVVAQGGLGGLRVLLDQQNTGTDHNLGGVGFGIFHALNAQVTVALLACLAVTHTRLWERAGAEPASPLLRRLGAASVILLLLVMLAAAVMRQNRVTLWVTGDIDLDGLFIPAAGDGWVWTVNLLHRSGALVAAVSLTLFANWLARSDWLPRSWGGSTPPPPSWGNGFAIAIPLLLATQVFLGVIALTLPSNPHPKTIHVIVAAALLSTTSVAALLCRRAGSGTR